MLLYLEQQVCNEHFLASAFVIKLLVISLRTFSYAASFTKLNAASAFFKYAFANFISIIPLQLSHRL